MKTSRIRTIAQRAQRANSKNELTVSEQKDIGDFIMGILDLVQDDSTVEFLANVASMTPAQILEATQGSGLDPAYEVERRRGADKLLNVLFDKTDAKVQKALTDDVQRRLTATPVLDGQVRVGPDFPNMDKAAMWTVSDCDADAGICRIHPVPSTPLASTPGLPGRTIAISTVAKWPMAR